MAQVRPPRRGADVLLGRRPTGGGTQETLVTAGLFWVFGRSKLAWIEVWLPILFWAVACVLLWRVGRRTLGEPRARLAAALFGMWPVYVVWKSTRAHGFYGAGLVFGLWSMLAALRLNERVTRAELVSLGLALGLGWWATPQIAILGLPAVAWLVWRRPGAAPARAARGGRVRARQPAVVALQRPRHGWPSLHAAPDPTTPLDHLHNLAVFDPSGRTRAAGAVHAPLARRSGRRAHPLRGVRARLRVAARPAPARARAAASRRAPLPAPLRRLAVQLAQQRAALPDPARARARPARAATAATSRARAAAIVAVAAALSVDRARADGARERRGAASRTAPRSLPSIRPLLRTLDRYGVDRVWTSYWIAYRVAFSSGERVIAAQLGSDRFAVRGGRVVQVGGEAAQPGTDGGTRRTSSRSRRHPPRLRVRDGGNLAPLVAASRRAGYRLVRSGGFDIWLPPAGLTAAREQEHGEHSEHEVAREQDPDDRADGGELVVAMVELDLGEHERGEQEKRRSAPRPRRTSGTSGITRSGIAARAPSQGGCRHWRWPSAIPAIDTLDCPARHGRSAPGRPSPGSAPRRRARLRAARRRSAGSRTGRASPGFPVGTRARGRGSALSAAE